MNKDNQQPSLACKALKEDSDYLIYEDGSLFSKKSNRFLSGKLDNVGYKMYALAIGNNLGISGKRKSKMVYVHRLVAQYFLDNPDNLPYVHHKDENKLNNHVSNLEWVTPKQNMKYHNDIHKEKKRSAPKYKLEDLPNEEWMIVPDYPSYSVSSYGRVVNNQTNRLLKGDASGKYIKVELGQRNKFYLHRLVYCVFHNDYDLDGFVIDHIDADPKNNSLSNLQKITQQENCLKQGRFND